MSECVVKVKLLTPDARVPTKAHDDDACWDLYASRDTELFSTEVTKVKTGVSLEIPPGWEGVVRSRSGLSLRGISMPGGPGTIDSGYRGEVHVPLSVMLEEVCYASWDGPEVVTTSYQISIGDRIAQIAFRRVPDVVLEVVESLSESARGTGGFGSTGK